MKRILSIALAATGIAILAQDVAQAQIPQYQAGPQTGSGGPTLKRSTRPAVSSYTGLLGGNFGAGGSFGYQFFTRVQPQINAYRAIRGLNTSVNRLQSQSPYNASAQTAEGQLATQQQPTAGNLPFNGIGTTGHPISYMSHTQFFSTNTQGGSSSGSSNSNGGLASTTSRRR